jgi:hypothetical protein
LWVYGLLIALWVVVMIMAAGVELGLLCGLLGVVVIGYRLKLMLSKRRLAPTPPQATIKPDEPPGGAPDRRTE